MAQVFQFRESTNIRGVATPADPTDAATKAYVDGILVTNGSSLPWRQGTGNPTVLSTDFAGQRYYDFLNDRVWVYGLAGTPATLQWIEDPVITTFVEATADAEVGQLVGNYNARTFTNINNSHVFSGNTAVFSGLLVGAFATYSNLLDGLFPGRTGSTWTIPNTLYVALQSVPSLDTTTVTGYAQVTSIARDTSNPNASTITWTFATNNLAGSTANLWYLNSGAAPATSSYTFRPLPQAEILRLAASVVPPLTVALGPWTQGSGAPSGTAGNGQRYWDTAARQAWVYTGSPATWQADNGITAFVNAVASNNADARIGALVGTTAMDQLPSASLFNNLNINPTGIATSTPWTASGSNFVKTFTWPVGSATGAGERETFINLLTSRFGFTQAGYGFVGGTSTPPSAPALYIASTANPSVFGQVTGMVTFNAFNTMTSVPTLSITVSVSSGTLADSDSLFGAQAIDIFTFVSDVQAAVDRRVVADVNVGNGLTKTISPDGQSITLSANVVAVPTLSAVLTAGNTTGAQNISVTTGGNVALGTGIAQLTVPSGDGTTGQVVSKLASGLLGWSTPNTTLAQTLTNGNTTGAQNIVVSTGGGINLLTGIEQITSVSGTANQYLTKGIGNTLTWTTSTPTSSTLGQTLVRGNRTQNNSIVFNATTATGINGTWAIPGAGIGNLSFPVTAAQYTTLSAQFMALGGTVAPFISGTFVWTMPAGFAFYQNATRSSYVTPDGNAFYYDPTTTPAEIEFSSGAITGTITAGSQPVFFGFAPSNAVLEAGIRQITVPSTDGTTGQVIAKQADGTLGWNTLAGSQSLASTLVIGNTTSGQNINVSTGTTPDSVNLLAGIRQLTVPTADGTTGQIIVKLASGLLGWQTPAATESLTQTLAVGNTTSGQNIIVSAADTIQLAASSGTSNGGGITTGSGSFININANALLNVSGTLNLQGGIGNLTVADGTAGQVITKGSGSNVVWATPVTESLTQTLAVGNTTSGRNITVSPGDSIQLSGSASGPGGSIIVGGSATINASTGANINVSDTGRLNLSGIANLAAGDGTAGQVMTKGTGNTVTWSTPVPQAFPTLTEPSWRTVRGSGTSAIVVTDNNQQANVAFAGRTSVLYNWANIPSTTISATAASATITIQSSGLAGIISGATFTVMQGDNRNLQLIMGTQRLNFRHPDGTTGSWYNGQPGTNAWGLVGIAPYSTLALNWDPNDTNTLPYEWNNSGAAFLRFTLDAGWSIGAGTYTAALITAPNAPAFRSLYLNDLANIIGGVPTTAGQYPTYDPTNRKLQWTNAPVIPVATTVSSGNNGITVSSSGTNPVNYSVAAKLATAGGLAIAADPNGGIGVMAGNGISVSGTGVAANLPVSGGGLAMGSTYFSIALGSNLTGSISNGVLTLNATGGGGGSLPTGTARWTTAGSANKQAYANSMTSADNTTPNSDGVTITFAVTSDLGQITNATVTIGGTAVSGTFATTGAFPNLTMTIPQASVPVAAQTATSVAVSVQGTYAGTTSILMVTGLTNTQRVNVGNPTLSASASSPAPRPYYQAAGTGSVTLTDVPATGNTLANVTYTIGSTTNSTGVFTGLALGTYTGTTAGNTSGAFGGGINLMFTGITSNSVMISQSTFVPSFFQQTMGNSATWATTNDQTSGGPTGTYMFPMATATTQYNWIATPRALANIMIVTPFGNQPLVADITSTTTLAGQTLNVFGFTSLTVGTRATIIIS